MKLSTSSPYGKGPSPYHGKPMLGPQALNSGPRPSSRQVLTTPYGNQKMPRRATRPGLPVPTQPYYEAYHEAVPRSHTLKWLHLSRRSFTLVQSGVRWPGLGSLQPPPPGSSDSPASASQVVGITDACHHSWLSFVFLVEMGFHHVDQADLELPTSGDLPTLAFQSAAGIAGMSHRAQPNTYFLIYSGRLYHLSWQWCDHSSLQLQSLRPKRSSCLHFLSSWGYRRSLAPWPRLECSGRLTAASASWVQTMLLPQPPEQLGP
ncbi:hypothetical protein AAY473_007271 [Plecturocebus cupreus]